MNWTQAITTLAHYMPLLRGISLAQVNWTEVTITLGLERPLPVGYI